MIVWEELWKKKPESFYKRLNTYGHYFEAGAVERFFEQVKAEGDRLKKEGLEQYAIAVEYYEKLEAIKTWLKDAPTPLFLVPGQSPFISETGMEVWLEKCPLKIEELGP